MNAIKISKNSKKYTIRQATKKDLPILAEIKQPLALHKDRIRDADGKKLLYLVVEKFNILIGFGLLVFELPLPWSHIKNNSHLPMMFDLQVKHNFRNQGAGTFLINRMEKIAYIRG